MLSGNWVVHRKQLADALESKQYQSALQLVEDLLVVDPNNISLLKSSLQALSGLSIYNEKYKQYLERGLKSTRTEADLYYYVALYALRVDENFHKALANMIFARSLSSGDTKIDHYFDFLKAKTGKSNVKLVFMHDWTFGHIVGEVDTWYRQQQLVVDRDTYFVFICGQNLINSAIIEIYRRSIPIADDCNYLHFSFRRYPDILHRDYIESLPQNSIEFENGPRYRSGKMLLSKELYDLVPLLKKSKTIFQFTPQDKARGARYLNKMGITLEKDIFVCLHVRGFRAKDKSDARPASRRHIENQDCRNADLESYYPAIEYLLAQGAHVIRIGKEEEPVVGFSHPNFVDYAGHARYQVDGDFMDLFLCAHCDFYFGGPSGLNFVATTTGVPSLFVNYLPYFPPADVGNDIYVPKLLRNKDDNSVVDFVEMTNKHLSKDINEQLIILLTAFSDYLDNFGVYHEDNEPDDILNATKEMWARTIEKRPFSEEDKMLDDSFWTQIPEHHWIRAAKPIMSPAFVRKHGVAMGILN